MKKNMLKWKNKDEKRGGGSQKDKEKHAYIFTYFYFVKGPSSPQIIIFFLYFGYERVIHVSWRRAVAMQ
jgi:hypothetical protein